MKIVWSALIIATTIIILASLLYFHKKRRGTKNTVTTRVSDKVIPAQLTTSWPLTIHVGILAPLANEATNHLVLGLTNLLKLSNRTHYKIMPFFGDNTRVTLFNSAQQIAQTCDILITVGVTCANIASEAHKELSTMPIIKACLREEQLKKLTSHSAETLVITTAYDYAQQVSLFKQIKPSAHYVCVAYRQNNDNMHNEALQLHQTLLSFGYTSEIQLISHNAHIDNQLSAFKHEYDTLFIMPHAVTASTIQELITYCSNKKMTLCAQEFDVVTLGATLGFGGYEKKLGNDIGHIIRNILEGKKKYDIHTIITHKPDYHCIINKTKAGMQGLNLELEYLTMLEEVHLFNPTSPIPHPQSRSNENLSKNI